MEFRPCIDIHNGKVKQIVGGTLCDSDDSASENFVSSRDAAYFARLFRKDGLTGGHVIMLNSHDSPHFQETEAMALSALAAYPGGLMIGGGITAENADTYLSAGASHVIVTSFVFRDGEISYVNLGKLETEVGPKRLVLDLSCRKIGGQYFIMTDRWQKATRTPLTPELIRKLSEHCAGFLVHGIDSEGKKNGIDLELIGMLSEAEGISLTYAGGISSFADIESIRASGRDRIDVTVGSALSIYGGDMDYGEVLRICR